jgi:undecaprenyl pyrophosphate phosphatase UppP
MFRFFIDSDQIEGGVLSVTGGDVNHIRNVLRMKIGDDIEAVDENGNVATCRIREISADEIYADVLFTEVNEAELSNQITLYMGLPKFDKMELIVQKAVELGVYRIVPVRMKRCVLKLDEKKAFKIGLFQCISVIPGVSRSMATIVGGMSQKLSRRKAAEFSFFLAVPTMAGATLLDLVDLFKDNAQWATSHNIIVLIVGCVVAFIVALLAMKWFVNFLTKYGFKAFGWYRIIVGIIILAMLLSGQSLQMVD